MEYDWECWIKNTTVLMMLDIIILQSMTGGNAVSHLVASYKEVAAWLIGGGFTFYALSVVKKIVNNHEKMKESIITYIVALVVFILLWQMI